MGITDPAQEYFKDGGWGWNGSEWVKLGVVWGYSDAYLERNLVNDCDVGTNWLYGTEVPAGEVWVVSSAYGRDTNNIVTAFYLGVDLDGVTYTIDHIINLAANVGHVWSGSIVLPAGARMYGLFLGCTVDDQILATFCGYKMKVE